jgi:hypothetical protein
MEVNTRALQEVKQRLKREKGRQMFEWYQSVRIYLLGFELNDQHYSG